MATPKITCIDCMRQFYQIDIDCPEYRCPVCQANFRVRESNGEFPATKAYWKNKHRICLEALAAIETYH